MNQVIVSEIKMNAEVDEIGTMLTTEKKEFFVPAFQREYSWKEKQCRQFLNDLLADYKKTDDNTPYYFGMMTVKNTDKGFMLIDGQQRFTTSLVFLYVVRDFFDSAIPREIHDDHFKIANHNEDSFKIIKETDRKIYEKIPKWAESNNKEQETKYEKFIKWKSDPDYNNDKDIKLTNAYCYFYEWMFNCLLCEMIEKDPTEAENAIKKADADKAIRKKFLRESMKHDLSDNGKNKLKNLQTLTHTKKSRETLLEFINGGNEKLSKLGSKTLEKFDVEDIKDESKNKFFKSLTIKKFNKLGKKKIVKAIAKNDKCNNFMLKLTVHFTTKFIITRLDIGDNNASQIFNRINDRGIGLSQSDLIKNYFLEIIDSEENWGKIVENIANTSADEDEFFRHCHISRNEWISPQKVFEKIKDKIEYVKNKKLKDVQPHHSKLTLDESTLKKIMNDELDKLVKMSEYYLKLKNPSCEEWDTYTQRDLEGFNEMKASSIYPILLCGYEQFGSGENLNKLVKIIMTYFFRTKIIMRVEETVINKFTDFACEIFRDENIKYDDKISKVKDLIKNGKVYSKTSKFDSRFPDDNCFCEKFEVFATPDSGISKYILKKLNDEMSVQPSKNLTKIDYTIATIEHIMPKTLGAKWKTYLGNDFKNHKDSLEKIGNKTLLTKQTNSVNSNKPFDEKCENYKNDIEISKAIAKFKKLKKKWNSKAINKKQTDYAECAKKIWKL